MKINDFAVLVSKIQHSEAKNYNLNIAQIKSVLRTTNKICCGALYSTIRKLPIKKFYGGRIS